MFGRSGAVVSTDTTLACEEQQLADGGLDLHVVAGRRLQPDDRPERRRRHRAGRDAGEHQHRLGPVELHHVDVVGVLGTGERCGRQTSSVDLGRRTSGPRSRRTSWAARCWRWPAARPVPIDALDGVPQRVDVALPWRLADPSLAPAVSTRCRVGWPATQRFRRSALPGRRRHGIVGGQGDGERLVRREELGQLTGVGLGRRS